jgi:hypothetical protein
MPQNASVMSAIHFGNLQAIGHYQWQALTQAFGPPDAQRGLMIAQEQNTNLGSLMFEEEIVPQQQTSQVTNQTQAHARPNR